MSRKITKESVFTAPGMKMPVIGLGTWQSSEAEVEAAVDTALEAGYRHIDTAFAYANEGAIGNVLKRRFESGKLKREDVFIVTKLPMQAMQANLVEEFLTKSLTALQLSYVDLYLIHNPVGLAPDVPPFSRDEQGNLKVDMNTDHVAIWKAMEAQVDAGRTKAIGVSNFNIRQIDKLLKIAQIRPANLQVEIYLYSQQKNLQEWSKKTGVTLCAYGPLGSPAMKEFIGKRGLNTDLVKDLNPLTDPVVQRIATAHNKTPAHVLLRHLIQLGIAVIPKSTNHERIKSNFQVFDFELSDAEMSELNALDKGEEGRRFVGEIFQGFERHPEYPFK